MIRAAFLTAAFCALAGAALADPCTRIPDRGPMPAELRAGQKFSGPVVYVGDGDSLCVETIRGIGGAGWVEVRLADFRAPELREPGGLESRNALYRLTFGRRLNCVARNRTYDRVAAACSLNGVGVGDRLRRLGVREGGR